MKVAIFGCLHGMLNDMYTEVQEYEEQRREEIDFILVCGDCQTIRHDDDLQCLSVPNKYKKLGDFPDYYSGKKRVPRLTIFVGGNHECSNYLMTLPYGGWVCDNMYYLGHSGAVKYRGFRIAGVSGIYNFHNCNRGRFERMPLDVQTIKSIYHTRRLDVFRLQLLQKNVDDNPIDVFLSHDWPVRIYDYGNKEQLLRFKPGFRSDVESRHGLGNPLTRPLLHQLRPKRWFAAHLHCRFYAKVQHEETGGQTEFLSLNKIENKRNFMEVLDLEPSKPDDSSDENLYHDEEWLTILRKTLKLETNSEENVYCPRIDEPAGESYFPTLEDINRTIEMLNRTGGLKIARNFRMVEPVIYNRPGNVQASLDRGRKMVYSNYQTDLLCSRLEMKIPANLKKQSWLANELPGSSMKSEEPEEFLDFYIDTKGET